jgi:hypothetical protein
MAEQLQDGTGTGSRVKVSKNNKLHTYAVSETISENASVNGNSYNINTGNITLTSANESGLLYFKNTGDNDIHVISIGYLMGASVGGSGDVQAVVLRNPSLGTVVSDEVLVGINQNKNAGSSRTLNSVAYKGAEGKVFTNGDDFYYSLIPSAGRGYVISTGSLVLPKGSSIGVKLTPQSGNTSMDLQVFLSVIEYTLD